MRRTTIALPDDLAELLEREARRRNTSASAIVRAALITHFRLDQPRTLPFANLGRSGRGDVASNLDEVLAKEWAPDAEADAFGRGR
jgi:predicted transcriptional regulator